jgi:hypothetical protein
VAAAPAQPYILEAMLASASALVPALVSASVVVSALALALVLALAVLPGASHMPLVAVLAFWLEQVLVLALALAQPLHLPGSISTIPCLFQLH